MKMCSNNSANHEHFKKVVKIMLYFASTLCMNPANQSDRYV